MQFRPSRYEVLPPVVKNLIIINGLMFLLTIVLGHKGIDIGEYLALHHWYSDKFRVWQFVTHMFMHGNVGLGSQSNFEMGFMHIFSNMFALWMFGSVIENYLGSKRFLTFYLICGIGASLLHLGVLTYEFNIYADYIHEFKENPSIKQLSILMTQNHYTASDAIGHELTKIKSMWENDPYEKQYSQQALAVLNEVHKLKINEGTVGASGAVFGLLFAFGYLFPNTLIYLYFFLPMKAKYFVALYAIFELYAGIQNSAGDNIAHFAHLGGMLVAFIVLKIWNKTNRIQFY